MELGGKRRGEERRGQVEEGLGNTVYGKNTERKDGGGIAGIGRRGWGGILSR
jgi:hypothetical protein